jgi:hypothetical protein
LLSNLCRARLRANSTILLNVVGLIACAASHLGRAAPTVSLAISMISPWQPDSSADRLAGSTMLATPVAWLGSTMTGKNVA